LNEGRGRDNEALLIIDEKEGGGGNYQEALPPSNRGGGGEEEGSNLYLLHSLKFLHEGGEGMSLAELEALDAAKGGGKGR